MCYGPLSARLTFCVPSAPIRRAIVALAADESRVRQAELSLWVTFTSFLPSRCIRFAQRTFGQPAFMSTRGAQFISDRTTLATMSSGHDWSAGADDQLTNAGPAARFGARRFTESKRKPRG